MQRYGSGSIRHILRNTAEILLTLMAESSPDRLIYSGLQAAA